ncbi:MAG TPA: hydantoinase B/oxoprolinase family protein, partial [Burkholderiaceae bacterium]|nr:hydantoinase B/oxoprolinase family protein [Burkholderiaceae bacterium]
SAGAHPGPAAYRGGGPLTVTDANVYLGRVQPAFFPSVFGPQADAPLDAAVVAQGFERLADDIAQATGQRKSCAQIAQGFLRIAVGNMAEAIRHISVQRGYDVSQYVLTVFGGAGGQHACAVADELGMRHVFIHPLAGVLSAYGMGLADQVAIAQRHCELLLDEAQMPSIEARAAQAAAQARDELLEQGVAPGSIRLEQCAHLKYRGTDVSLVVSLGSCEQMRADFESVYTQRFSFLMAQHPIVVASVSAQAIGPGEALAPLEDAISEPVAPAAAAHSQVRVYFESGADGQDGWCDIPLFEERALQRGQCIEGPAIIAQANATTVIDPGWQAQVGPRKSLVLTRRVPKLHRTACSTQVDPIFLEIFNNRFMSIAEQMGLRLQATAHSVNIKERLDFSCALFDQQGALIANAPHMPVHLGSMSESIRAVMRDNQGRIKAGDAYVINDPYQGGTHLPDVTIVTPVFDRAGQHILFYVASRGHHADIGGMSPGSMPPHSSCIEEEGVRLTNFQLVVGRGVDSAGRVLPGRFREAECLAVLSSGKYPARNPVQNIADMRAQIAANEKGREELLALVDEFGLPVVQAYMGHVKANASEAVRKVIRTLRSGEFSLKLDNGAVIRVAVHIDASVGSASIDFSGTSAQQANNFNAPSSICVAAVLYVFRSLVDEEIPLNAGCLEPIAIHIPDGCLLSPSYPAAVVAGNVETSMCVTDALYGALGVLASSQGTMNNFTFGDAMHQYYETISGGSGAGPGFHGTDVVQTHMTNSRLTDPEVLELRFPVRVDSYVIRPNSGGRGQWHGGNGGVRRIRFLKAMSASILSNNRKEAPFGLAGGKAGKSGRNWIERADASRVELGATAQVAMQAGDVFVIETPGGGGYGSAVRGKKPRNP